MTTIKNNNNATSTEEQAPLRIIIFCSRHKDNKELPDFVQRNKKFLSRKTDEELMEEFDDFVDKGLPGEFCRFYVSINARDNESIRRNLLHWLIDHPEQDMAQLRSRSFSIAAHSDCRAEKKWLFDFDTDPALYEQFKEDILACDANVEVEAFPTPNGLSVITNRGFDVRKLDLSDKWKDVELKKDSNRCIVWKQKEA